MARPNFITNEQITYWSDLIDNDDTLSSFLKDSALFREIMYAAHWMIDELEKLNCPDHQIVQLQFTHGFEAFGCDPWEKAQEILSAYKNGELEFEDYEINNNLDIN
jgi:hypothetical protein